MAPLLDVMGKVNISFPRRSISLISYHMFGRQKCANFFFLLQQNQSRFYLGDVGNGAAMKLVVNMVMGRWHKIIHILQPCYKMSNPLIAIVQILQYDGFLLRRVAPE